MRTQQEVFDRIATHLLTQGRRAESRDRCEYRDDNGFKCAVGCLIPDDKYEPAFEGLLVYDKSYTLEEYAPGMCMETTEELWQLRKDAYQRLQAIIGEVTDDCGLLLGLQNIHDRLPVSVWPQQLQNFALENDLDPSVPDQAIANNWKPNLPEMEDDNTPEG